MTPSLFARLTSSYNFSLPESYLRTIGDNINDRHHSYIFIDSHGNPLGAFGLVIMWDRVGEVWLLTTDNLNSRPLSMMRILKKTLASLMLTMHRIQMVVKESDKPAIKFAEALGFTSEGLMIRYGVDGSNQYMMARYA